METKSTYPESSSSRVIDAMINKSSIVRPKGESANNILPLKDSFLKAYEKKIEDYNLQQLTTEYSKVSALNSQDSASSANTFNQLKIEVLEKALGKYSLDNSNPETESRQGSVHVEKDPTEAQALLLKIKNFVDNGRPFLIGDTLIAHASPSGVVTDKFGNTPSGKVANRTLAEQLGLPEGNNINKIITCHPKAVDENLNNESVDNMRTFTNGESSKRTVMYWNGGKDGKPLVVAFQTEEVFNQTKRQEVAA